MADVFISYAKESRGLVEWLAAELGASGYSVWWDTELVGGRNYREVILKELAEARAVIVVWTPASARSEWVISEADRARAQHKLLPVKVPELGVHDIPPPFDVLHTEDVRDVERIERALAHLIRKEGLHPGDLARALGMLANTLEQGGGASGTPRNRFESMSLEQLIALGSSVELLNKLSDKEFDQFKAAFDRKQRT